MKTFKIEVELELEAEDLEEAEDILRDILDSEPVISEFRLGAMSSV